MNFAAGAQGPADVFLPELPASPYPGLRPFEKSEWPIFFGRERMIDQVTEQLLRQRIVVVHGVSGGGKSSLVRAGVQARLEQEHARSGLRWRTCSMRPGNRPLANLAEALSLVSTDEAAPARIDVRRALNHGRQAPTTIGRLLNLGETNRVCILLDQFEELFRFTGDFTRDESILLTDFLIGLEENPPDGIYVLVTMRSEFLGECARFEGLAEAINRTQYLLPRMTTSDLLHALREPASLYGGIVTERLAERLIADAHNGQDELPLVQHGLSRLWNFAVAKADAENGVVLDLPIYEEWGPLGRLLSDHADAVAEAAIARSEADARIVEELFRALTDINADGHAIRRPREFSELVAVTGSTEASLRLLLEDFRQPGVSFVTPYAPLPILADTTIDISHEALIRRWEKISDPKDGWLQREFRDGLIWRSLVVQADSFAANPKHLLSEATTEARSTWLAGRNKAWSLRYGGKWPAVGELMVESQRDLERRRSQRQVSERRLWYIRAAAVIIAVTVCLSGIALYQEQQAAKQADIAQKQTLEALAQKKKAEEALSKLGGLAAGLGQDLSSGQATVAFAAVVENIRNTSDPDVLVKFIGVMQALAPSLSDEQIHTAFAAVLDAINRTSQPEDLRKISGALGILAQSLSPNQAAAAFGTALDFVQSPDVLGLPQFPSLDEQGAAKKVITEQWDSVVGAQVQ